MECVIRWSRVLGVFWEGSRVTCYLGTHEINHRCSTEASAKELYDWYKEHMDRQMAKERGNYSEFQDYQRQMTETALEAPREYW